MEKESRTLVKRHAFGARSEVKGGLGWLDEGILMFPVGKSVALHSVTSNNQRFLEANYMSSSITALAVSANKKFVAIAEGGENPQVQIVDTVTRKRRKVLSVGDLGSDRFTALSFSADGRHLVTQGGAPGWNLYYWNWERSKPLAHIAIGSATELGNDATADGAPGSPRVESPKAAATASLGTSSNAVTNVQICPSDPLVVTVSGAGFMRYYQYNGGVLQTLPSCGIPREHQEVFTTHSWVTESSVIASTQRGALVHIHAGRYLGVLPAPATSAASYTNNTQTVTVIIPMRNGFVAGTDRNRVCIYEQLKDPGAKDEGNDFHLLCTQRAPDCEKGELKDVFSPVGPAADSPDAEGAASGEGSAPGSADAEGSGAAAGGGKKALFQIKSAAVESAEAAPRLAGGVVPALPGNAPVRHGIASLAIDQSEENMAVMTTAGRLFVVDFRQDWGRVEREGRELLFDPICQPFHTGGINGMDCSVRKPFLITTSSDNSVRIWNTTSHTLEMVEFFKQEPGAVAIHPSGLMAVICFPDKVYVMSVLWNSLRERTVINFRNSSAVKFSSGGQYFAIAHGNLVDVFVSATCELHGQLRGHPQRVRDLMWCSTTPYPTDNRLVTCSSDGMVMDWNIVDMRKEIEHSDKRFLYNTVASDDKNVWVVAEPTSATALEAQWRVTLRELDRHSMGAQNASSEDYEFTDATLTTLHIATHQRILFAGTENGSLKVMTLPLQAGVQEAPTTAHCGDITCMALAFDETAFYTASSDGSIFVWDIRDDGRKTQDAPPVTDEVLVTRQELEDNKIQIESLQQQVEKIKTDIDSEEKRRNHEQGTRVRERAEEFKGDVATLAAEYATLWNSKSEQERSFVAIKLEKEADAAHKMEELERARQTEVQELEEQCNTLQYTLDQEQIEHATALRELAVSIGKDQAMDAEHYADVLSQRQETLDKLQRHVDRCRQTNDETINQLELDVDVESETVAGKHQKELNGLRERFLHMKGEGAIMRKNAIRTEREIEVRVGETRLLDSAKTALSAQLTDLNHRMAQLHQDIDERDAVIGEKERSIYTLKKQNQELEKHKFVLDHRIRQLKAQMEPKQREITQHNQHITQSNEELEALHASNLTLRENIEELKGGLAQQQQHTKHLLSRIKDFETYKGRFQKDVGELAAALQEPTLLRDTLEQLYQVHVTSRGGQRTAAADQLIQQEFRNQLGYLSTSVDALRRKVKGDQERHKKEVSQMMMENMSLIREIHGLRTEINQQRAVLASEEAARRSRGVRRRQSVDGSGPSTPVSSASPLAHSTAVPGAATSSVAPPSRSGRVSIVSVGRRHGGRSAKSNKAPDPPRAIEDNRTEIRMLRAYIEAMERSAALASRPASGARLPPIGALSI